MTIGSVVPSERSLVRFATHYLEVERQPISSLERTIVRGGGAGDARREEEEAEARANSSTAS